jgi:hypothetical protein
MAQKNTREPYTCSTQTKCSWTVSYDSIYLWLPLSPPLFCAVCHKAITIRSVCVVAMVVGGTRFVEDVTSVSSWRETQKNVPLFFWMRFVKWTRNKCTSVRPGLENISRHISSPRLEQYKNVFSRLTFLFLAKDSFWLWKGEESKRRRREGSNRN